MSLPNLSLPTQRDTVTRDILSHATGSTYSNTNHAACMHDARFAAGLTVSGVRVWSLGPTEQGPWQVRLMTSPAGSRSPRSASKLAPSSSSSSQPVHNAHPRVCASAHMHARARTSWVFAQSTCLQPGARWREEIEHPRRRRWVWMAASSAAPHAFDVDALAEAAT